MHVPFSTIGRITMKLNGTASIAFSKKAEHILNKYKVQVCWRSWVMQNLRHYKQPYIIYIIENLVWCVAGLTEGRPTKQ